MARKKLGATLGAAALLGLGVAAAALADPPPTTTDSTTTATTTGVSTTTTTSTVTTTTTTTETTTSATEPTSTTRVQPPPPRATRPTPAVPAGATVRDTPSGIMRSARARREKHRQRISKPLRATPPLGRGSYVFPVVGVSGYGDSYGTFRGDVHGKWHHGDDVFAPLGAPVVAVADGTVNRVGWHRIGGWRLWVRDAAADQFYYAHLSGYAPGIFHSKRVRAGQVIGFVGNTGDAFTGAPHLHFEIHPHQLLRLRYDGAVDPTTYLNSWPRVRTVEAPLPVHPRLPKQARSRSEARQVFRELLVARHLIVPSPGPVEQPETDRPAFSDAAPLPQRLAGRSARATPTAAEGPTFTIPLLVGLLLIAVVMATSVLATVALGGFWRERLDER